MRRRFGQLASASRGGGEVRGMGRGAARDLNAGQVGSVARG
jgi:hypothetical protein